MGYAPILEQWGQAGPFGHRNRSKNSLDFPGSLYSAANFVSVISSFSGSCVFVKSFGLKSYSRIVKETALKTLTAALVSGALWLLLHKYKLLPKLLTKILYLAAPTKPQTVWLATVSLCLLGFLLFWSAYRLSYNRKTVMERFDSRFLIVRLLERFYRKP